MGPISSIIMETGRGDNFPQLFQLQVGLRKASGSPRPNLNQGSLLEIYCRFTCTNYSGFLLDFSPSHRESD